MRGVLGLGLAVRYVGGRLGKVVRIVINLLTSTTSTRATVKTALNEGLVETFAINTPAFSDGLLSNEGSGTNVLWPSEDFTTAQWTKFEATVSPNAATAPDGNLTADKIVESAANNAHVIFQSYTLSGDITFTIYAKAAERTWAVMRGDIAETWFDLSNCLVGTTGAGVTASIESLPNGWCRLRATVNAVSANVQIGAAISDGVSSYLGDITKGIYIWGADAKNEAYPTSYKQTTVATSTRGVDISIIPIKLVTVDQGAVIIPFIPSVEGQVNKYLFSPYVDATHYLDVYVDATTVYAAYNNGGITSIASFAYTHLLDTQSFAVVYWDTVLNEIGISAAATEAAARAATFGTNTFIGLDSLPASAGIGSRNALSQFVGLFDNVTYYVNKAAL